MAQDWACSDSPHRPFRRPYRPRRGAADRPRPHSRACVRGPPLHPLRCSLRTCRYSPTAAYIFFNRLTGGAYACSQPAPPTVCEAPRRPFLRPNSGVSTRGPSVICEKYSPSVRRNAARLLFLRPFSYSVTKSNEHRGSYRPTATEPSSRTALKTCLDIMGPDLAHARIDGRTLVTVPARHVWGSEIDVFAPCAI